MIKLNQHLDSTIQHVNIISIRYQCIINRIVNYENGYYLESLQEANNSQETSNPLNETSLKKLF